MFDEHWAGRNAQVAAKTIRNGETALKTSCLAAVYQHGSV
jgi:hypothetical protein